MFSRLWPLTLALTLLVPAGAWGADSISNQINAAKGRALTAEEQKRFEAGESIYELTCIACHQFHGMGLEALAPPLAGSEWVVGSEERLIRIVLQGMRGRVAVKGHDWDMEMPPLSILSDDQVAQVSTYVRLEWANGGAPVDPAAVKKAREATAARTEPWTAPELTNTVAVAVSTNAAKGTPAVVITPVAKPFPSILRGPYLQSGTTNGVVVRWRTDVASPSVVRYGSSITNLNRKTNSAGNLTEHVVLVSGLKPDTKYYYAIGSADSPIFATVSNNLVLIRTTNGTMAVSTVHRRQLALVTNQTLILSASTNEVLIGNPRTHAVVNSEKTELVVTTTNNALLVTLTNGTLAATTTNQTRIFRPHGTPPGRTPLGSFVVLNTNVTTSGGDSNTFFITAPPSGVRKPIRVWVLGDPGTRTGEQRKVRDSYFKYAGGRNPDLWLMLGDNAYEAGTDAEYQGSVFQMYPDILKSCVLWPTLGNHDAGHANSPTQSGVYYDIFTLPTQAQAGGVMSGTEAYYSFDYANVHFICLDSSNSDRSTNGLMMKWLQADLAANRQDWCLAYFHHPPYTKGSHDSDNDKENDGLLRDLRTLVVPVLEAGGVDLVLTGHSHAYERSFLLDGLYGRSTTFDEEANVRSNRDGNEQGWGAYQKPTPGPAPHEGTIYVVAGSSGHVSGGGLLHSAMYAGLNVLGSLVLDFDGLRMDSRFLDGASQVRDHFTVLKGPSAAPTSDSAEGKFIQVGDLKVPEHLASLVRKDGLTPSRSAATNATPADQEILFELYQNTADPSQKAALTWALAYVGNAQVTASFLRLVTNQFHWKEISLEQEDICLETIQALGFLATRYEAPYELLKKSVSPSWWQEHHFWYSPRGYQSAALVASASFRALGLSGRPEAAELLTSTRKKDPEYKIKEYPDYARKFTVDLDKAIAYHGRFQKQGRLASQRAALAGDLSLAKPE